MSHSGKAIRELEREAAKLGYRYGGKTRRGHVKWLGDNGRIVITGTDWGQWRNWKNSITTLRRGRTKRRDIMQ